MLRLCLFCQALATAKSYTVEYVTKCIYLICFGFNAVTFFKKEISERVPVRNLETVRFSDMSRYRNNRPLDNVNTEWEIITVNAG